MVIKLNRILAVTVLAAVIFCSLGYRYIVSMHGTQAVAEDYSVQHAIIIDAGHGGEDGGAVAYDGTTEKTLNLNVALKLREICELAGYRVLMTRQTDQSLSGADFNKNLDMRARIQLTQEHPSAIFVSIHMNKFSVEKYSGAQVFYSDNNPSGERLAQSIQQEIRNNLQENNSRQIKVGNDSSILLKNIKNPAVIVECGFISNHAELKLLQDEAYQTKMAYCIFLGILKYHQEMDG